MTDLFAGLCDDAAVFPPGDLPLARAVPAHVRHREASYAGVVGSFVLTASDLDALAPLVADLDPFPLSVTVPLPGVAAALAAVDTMPTVDLVGLEVALTEETAPDQVVPALASVEGVQVFVELPRDGRRGPLLAELAGSPYLAKLRTGGVRAELYPDETALAETVHAAVRAGVPFKATAGLHHALRNTDPATGFEQHGFLNLLTAAEAAADGAGTDDLVALLAERDPDTVVAAVRRLGPRARATFRSFGTCSITDPVAELVDLGLLPADHRTEVPA